jgi:hypothetical protein
MPEAGPEVRPGTGTGTGAEIILHAGTHKTATTTIQEALTAHRDRLARAGLIYPAIGRAAGHHLLAAEWLEHLAPYGDGTAPAAHWAGLAARHAGGTGTVLVSSEEFSRKGPQAVPMAALMRRLAPFPRRRVVVVLRNQLAYIQSLYLEMQRQYRMPAFGEYLRHCLARDHASGMYLDYAALLETLAGTGDDGFAPGEIRLLSYEALGRGERPIAAAFLAALGLDAAADALDAALSGALAGTRGPAGAARANASPEPLASWVANQLTAPEVAGADTLALVGEALAEEFDEGVATTLYTAAEIARVQARFEPMNRRLEERYAAMGGEADFSLAPLRLRPGLVHRDELTPTFWLKLARRLYRTTRPAAATPAPAAGRIPA